LPNVGVLLQTAHLAAELAQRALRETSTPGGNCAQLLIDRRPITIDRRNLWPGRK